MRIIFLTVHRKDRSPSQRFRFEQYLAFLSENNFEVNHFYLVSEKDDKLLYSKGNLFKKALLLLKYVLRLVKLCRGISSYDICFVQREVIFLWTFYFEKIISKKTNLVYDFDDSIFLPNISENNKNFSFLKGYRKIKKIIEISDLIFAGNSYLEEYALNYNKNVKIVPTTIDTVIYSEVSLPKSEFLTIGWSGSVTTIKHFEYAVPFLKIIKEKYGDAISIKVIGDKDYLNKDLDIIGLPWVKETELIDLSSIDIGIMPLPDDKWSKGKCGLKGLQYMSLGIPTLMSPVGVNSEIIEDGVNGFLCDDIDEWVDRISQLIESPKLRTKIGANGRQTVETKYSVNSWKHKYLNYFESLLNEKNSIIPKTH